jgi:hypothetical protein
LYHSPSGGSKVFAWYPNDEVEYLEGARSDREVKAALESTRLAANDFTEFVYRLWLEGSLYFKLKYRIPLDRAESEYVETVRQG